MHSFLPSKVQILGYARTEMTDEDLRGRLRGYIKGNPEAVERFLSLCSYVAGDVSAAPKRVHMAVPQCILPDQHITRLRIKV